MRRSFFLLFAVAVDAHAQARVGTFVGDGAATRQVGPLGFAPDFVVVKAVTAELSTSRLSTMPAGTHDPDRITSLDPDGFTVATRQINTAGVTYGWAALKRVPGSIEVGSYTGTGDAGQRITVGFAPTFVVVLPLTGPARQRFVTQPPSQSYDFFISGAYSDSITAFTTDGFVVGGDDEVNGLDGGFHWLAVRDVPGRIATGTYLGDGGDDRAITGIGFRPEFLNLKGPFLTNAQARYASLDGFGDSTSYWIALANQPDAIQRLLPDGFEVGTTNDVNFPGNAYHWVALSAAPVVDTAIVAQPLAIDPSPIATFRFSATQPDSGFECQLDTASQFSSCANPVTFGPLALGAHALAVRAREPLGFGDPTPATYGWTVIDAGAGDAGARDAGTPDAGAADAGPPDAGTPLPADRLGVGCSCNQGPAGLLLAALALLARPRRRAT